MKTKIALSLAMLIMSTANIHAACTSDRSAFLKKRHSCLSLFRKATAPDRMEEKGGYFVLKEPETLSCFSSEKREFPDFSGSDSPCIKKAPAQMQAQFKELTDICITQSNTQACDKKIKDSKIDNFRNAKGVTLLMAAAKEGNVEAMDFFLEKGASVKKTDHYGNGILHYALSPKKDAYDDLEKVNDVVKKFIDKGAHPQDLNLFGENALHVALRNNMPASVIETLVKSGANPNMGIDLGDIGYAEEVVRPNLMIAIEERRSDAVDILLKNGANPNNGDFVIWKWVWDPAFISILSKEPIQDNIPERDKIAILLLKAGINPNGLFFPDEEAVKKTNSSVFAIALLSEASPSVIDAFLDAGVDVSTLIYGGQPFDPMRMAIINNSTRIVDGLLKKGYNVNKPLVRGISAFDLAIALKNKEIVQKFIKAKADVNRKIEFTDEEGRVVEIETPLYLAVQDPSADIEIVKMLLREKANPNKHWGNEIPLGVAIQNGREDLVELLIKVKADVNAVLPKSDNMTMMEKAQKHGNAAIIEMLRKAGAKTPFRGDFVQYCLNPDLTEKMVLDAIKDGADVNEVEEEQGWTPLHSVAQNGKDPKAMNVLIKRGAFVNAMTKGGFTPLLSAARFNPNPSFIKMLIAAGADIEARSSGGWNALQIAIGYNTPAVVQLLLSTSLGSELSNSDKNILLRTAVINNPDPKVLVALFKAGFKAEPENSWWDKPLHAAIENKAKIDIIKTLLQGKAVVDDRAMRLARDLPMETSEDKKYRNQVIDLLTKHKKKR